MAQSEIVPQGYTMVSERDKQVLEHFSQLIVSCSMGKDSVLCLLWALHTGKPVRVVLTDTGNEPPDTPEYIRYIEQALQVQVEIYQRSGHTFGQICKRRGMWPIPAKCLVSRTTKVDDFKWHLENTGTPQDALIILGQRRSESKRRKKLPDFAPIIRSGRACYRPILDLSVDDVFTALDEHGVKAHPAYAQGRKRVGCVWCVNSAHDDLVRDEELYPERCAELRALRKSIGLPSVPQGTSQSELFAEWPLCRYAAVHCE